MLALILGWVIAPAVAVTVALGAIQYVLGTAKPRNRPRKLRPGEVRTVAVVGAGCSGIAAAKEAKEAGLDVTVFEASDCLGGNWCEPCEARTGLPTRRHPHAAPGRRVYREEEQHSSVYRSTSINTSRQLMSFSDFPMPRSCVYPTHREIVRYFESYSSHFGVRDLIRFHHAVESVVKGDGGGYTLRVRDGKGKVKEHDFDAVMVRPAARLPPSYLARSCLTAHGAQVASGHHHEKHEPEFPGRERFRGRVFHSHAYKHVRNPVDCEGKRVVVVGIGNSGVDIAVELSRATRSLHLSTRTGAWILPKYVFGKPLDHVIGMRRLLRMMMPEGVLLPLLNQLGQLIVTLQQGSMRAWGLHPGSPLMSTHPTVSQELLHRVGTGAVQLARGLREFTADGVVLQDGTAVPADVVILCTGYHISFPFLGPELVRVEDNRVRLWKHVLPTAHAPTLSVIGLIQPLGAIMPISEMQARWVAALLTGREGLPPPGTMEREIDHTARVMARRYLKRRRHTIQVDFDSYMDCIARELGVVPSVLRHPGLARALLCLPVLPAQYRLDGQGAKPEQAEEALRLSCREVMHPRPETVKM